MVDAGAADDALLRAVLVKLFADRQLAVDESLVGYLATRIERSFAARGRPWSRSTSEALRQQRPVTRALAAELLRAGDLDEACGLARHVMPPSSKSLMIVAEEQGRGHG